MATQAQVHLERLDIVIRDQAAHQPIGLAFAAAANSNEDKRNHLLTGSLSSSTVLYSNSSRKLLRVAPSRNYVYLHSLVQAPSSLSNHTRPRAVCDC